MTGTRIRDALTEVAHAIDVPTPDRFTLERRVRAERGRRRTRRGLGVGAAAAVVLGSGLALGGLPGGDADGSRGSGVATAGPSSTGSTGMNVPAVLDGHLVWVGENLLVNSGQPATRVLGLTDDHGAVVEDDRSRVWFVPEVRVAGTPERFPRADGRVVRDAVVDRTGSWLTFADTTGTVHVRSTSDDVDVASGGIGDAQLVAGNGRVWVVLRDGRVTVEGPGQPVVLDALEDATGVQIGENTAAVQTIGGASFFAVDTGRRLQLDLGGAVGGLSPDGASYATAAGEQQRADGMSPNLNLIAVESGEMRSVHGFDDAQQALSVWWADADRFAVLAQDGDQRVLWGCSASADRCEKTYTDPTGTLELPGQE